MPRGEHANLLLGVDGGLCITFRPQMRACTFFAGIEPLGGDFSASFLRADGVVLYFKAL